MAITNIKKIGGTSVTPILSANIDNIDFNNIPAGSKGTKGSAFWNISTNTNVWKDGGDGTQWKPGINAVDIDWNGAQIMNGENVIATINTSGELISVLTEYQNIQKSNSTDTLYLLASTSSEGGYKKVAVSGSLKLNKGVLYINNVAVATKTDLTNEVTALTNDMNAGLTELETSINAVDKEVKKIGSGKIENSVNVAYVDADNNYVGTDAHIDLVVSYANGNITNIKFECPRGPLVTKDYVDYFIAEVREPQATETSYGTVKLFNGDVNDKDASYYTSYAIATGAGHKHGNYATKSDLSNAVTTLTNNMTEGLTGLQTDINAVDKEIKKIGSGKIENSVNVAYVDADNNYVGTDAHIDLVVSYANGNITNIKFECPRGPLVTKDYVDYFIAEVREPQATETSYGTVKLYNGDVNDKDASYYTSYAVAVGVAHKHSNYATQEYVTVGLTGLQTDINAVNNEVKKIGSGKVSKKYSVAYVDVNGDPTIVEEGLRLEVSYANGNVTGVELTSKGYIATQEYVDCVVGSAIEPQATETSYGTVKLYNGDVDSKDASYYTSYAVAVGVAHKHSNYATQSDLSTAVTLLNGDITAGLTGLQNDINTVDSKVNKIGSGTITSYVNVAYIDEANDYVGTDGHIDLVVSYANGNIDNINFACSHGPIATREYVDYVVGSAMEPQATETSYGTVKLFNGNVNDKDASYYTSYAIATGAGHRHGNYEDKLNQLRDKINEIITYFNTNITLIDEFNW